MSYGLLQLESFFENKHYARLPSYPEKLSRNQKTSNRNPFSRKMGASDPNNASSDHRIGKTMDQLLHELQRRSDEEMVDFNLRWAREVNTAGKVAGELQGN